MDGFQKGKLISENSQPVAQVLTLKLGLSEIHSVDTDLVVKNFSHVKLFKLYKVSFCFSDFCYVLICWCCCFGTHSTCHSFCRALSSAMTFNQDRSHVTFQKLLSQSHVFIWASEKMSGWNSRSKPHKYRHSKPIVKDISGLLESAACQVWHESILTSHSLCNRTDFGNWTDLVLHVLTLDWQLHSNSILLYVL